MRLPIAPEGTPFILAPAIASAACLLLGALALLAGLSAPGWTAAACGLACIVSALLAAFFFRDPERNAPAAAGLIVAPADGRVVRAGPLEPQEADAPEGARWVLSIFLSITDVHVNRSPASGTIEAVVYRPGRFRPAFRHSASVENERNEVRLRTSDGVLTYRQIAGVLARRVVFRHRAGDRVDRGQRIGLIRFGSRMDVFLPEAWRLSVEAGDRVLAGETVIARRHQRDG